MRWLLALALLLPQPVLAQQGGFFRGVVLPSASAAAGRSGLACAGSTTFAADSFTGTSGTALTAHTPTTGTAWTVPTGTDTVLLNGGGGAYKSTTSSSYYTVTATPASADYYVEATFNVKSVISTDESGLMARSTNGSTTYIYATYIRSVGKWEVDDSGGLSSQVTGAAPVNGDVMRLTVVGSQVAVSLNGVQVAGPFTTTVLTANKAGLVMRAVTTADTTTTGTHLTNFIAKNC